MKELNAVTAAVSEVNELVSEMEGDLVRGGFRWWQQYVFDSDPNVDSAIRTDLSDYLIDVTTGVASNLESAAIYLSDYQGKKFDLDFKRRRRLDEGMETAHAIQDEGREKVLRAYAAAFIGSVSAVLDTLAGIIVGVAGLKTSLIKADMTIFSPFDASEDYFTLAKLSSKLEGDQGGPPRKASSKRSERAFFRLALRDGRFGQTTYETRRYTVVDTSI